MKLVLWIIANCLAVLAANWLVPGFVFSGNWKGLLIAGATIGIINSLIRPVLKLLALPVIIITLGLASTLINIGLLYLAASFLPSLQINGFWPAFWATIIISLVNYIFSNLKDE